MARVLGKYYNYILYVLFHKNNICNIHCFIIFVCNKTDDKTIVYPWYPAYPTQNEHVLNTVLLYIVLAIVQIYGTHNFKNSVQVDKFTKLTAKRNKASCSKCQICVKYQFKRHLTVSLSVILVHTVDKMIYASVTSMSYKTA